MLQLVAGGLQPITNEVTVTMRFRLVENNEKEIVDFQVNSNYNIVEDLERSFIETEEFTSKWKKFGFDDDDLKILQNDILKEKGWILLGGKVYKIRFSPQELNKGKSTSDRVMFIDIVKEQSIYLMNIFSKADQANVSGAELKLLKQAAEKFGGKKV